MATSLDMTLDDMVKRNKSERGRGRGRPRRGRGFFGGGRMTATTLATRRGPLAVNARPSQHSIAKSSHRTRSTPWQHDLFEDSLRAAGISGVEVGTKLYVSNLDLGVTNEDIRELFSEIGELKRYAVHYDKNGRPSGSAEVVYLRRSDAFAALKRYNNVLLDGKPMKIEIVGANAEVPISARVNVTGMNGRRKRAVVLTPGPGQSRSSAGTNRGLNRRGGMRSGRSGSRGRGRGRGKKKPIEKSADDLDKELENYHAEAMNVS
ncbi:THO complex subunit 4D-like [Herrania umbratica]|uniref:THO complex subunit 4D-like n=1 Tax=Herrania umbratica TaxID=108875 RepID=A0A6J1BJ46_9ROSI|nr:THO complex subunit 4D-like [Herrania umbratica]XP_021299472.1 THO complex subunit 4D-like [Herrania umbratica]XP_021299473.1 THO complex subunit 4D-like [Herrania umbratica]